MRILQEFYIGQRAKEPEGEPLRGRRAIEIILKAGNPNQIQAGSREGSQTQVVKRSATP